MTWSDAASGYVAAPGTIAGGSRTGTATLTLIFGLLGLIGGIVFGWGFPFAIAALVLAPRALRGDPAGHARARRGRTLALVGLVATVVWFGYSVLRFIDLLLN
ncbi:hypothetical protein D9V32_02025 [Mycetocola tolaasinivorans]|uniref:DUF4190 domain-containing protein n=1 Tax=Mycetocola tolaasinivorans TaxID=76635 RepID=A0A3L7A9Z5_9MICO|nr:hypothetical protein D9V32_02025 [Mycetocola tolaasinivorans]